MGKKKQQQQQQDNYWDNADELEKDAAAMALDEPAPVTVDAEAEADEGGGLMSIMKKQKQKKASTAADGGDGNAVDAEEGAASTVKSKKEKEKERKERLKQKKKAESTKSTPKASAADQSSSAAPADSAASKTTKGKKGGPPVAALREFLAAKQAAEEEDRKREEAQKAAEAARILQLEEEDRLRELAKEAKRERERAKREQLKKEGKFVTEAERKRRQLNQLKLEQLKTEQGLVIPDTAETPEDESVPTTFKRVVYDSKKKKKKDSSHTPPVDHRPLKEQKTEEVTAPASVETPPVEEMVVDEAVAEPDDEEVTDNWEDVADSWEDLGESEEKGESQIAADKDQKKQQKQEDSSDSDSDDGMTNAEREVERRRQEAKQRRNERVKTAIAARSAADLRSPICVILGHVDTGKTKLLDKVRQTNVQEGEAGGITQQIGATYFPADSIVQKTQVVRDSKNYSDISSKAGFRQDFQVKVPGLLIIDTPGHESFTNLRSRGSSLCNIAILVVDIMHGLEPQTIESIGLLKARKTPFIVALNKIDRIYGWVPIKDNSFQDSLKQQPDHVLREFEDRLLSTTTAFAEQGLNAQLYTRNQDVRKYVSMVPTSAITGEGVPDLLSLLIQLTQDRLTDSLMFLSELEATVLEVKVIEGHGTTIDVILSNGVLHEGDRIVICGLNGPIVTNIRALLTPQPMRELRVKSAYVHHKEIKAAMGVKISAPDLDKAIAGSRLLVMTPDDDEEELKEEVMSDLVDLFESVDKSGKGVCVQASTIGSLEALLSFLKVSKIPVAGINIGPIHRKDVIRASAMLERAKEFATILAFDVKMDKDAQEMADSMGVRIFSADIIYHLFDQFTAYMKNIKEERKNELSAQAIWPCHVKIIPGAIFNKKDPIIVGVDVVDGSLRLGTPLCIPARGCVVIGRVAGIEANKKPVDVAKKGQQVSVRIEGASSNIVYGRHFDDNDEMVSMISRKSIDVLKECFRDDVSREEWLLIKKLKTTLKID